MEDGHCRFARFAGGGAVSPQVYGHLSKKRQRPHNDTVVVRMVSWADLFALSIANLTIWAKRSFLLSASNLWLLSANEAQRAWSRWGRCLETAFFLGLPSGLVQIGARGLVGICWFACCWSEALCPKLLVSHAINHVFVRL